MASNDTTLMIKNPSRSNQHFSISFHLDGTIAELQQLLCEKYDGKPAPADQTLIYGGKVLKDTSVRLRDIVSKHDAPEGPHSIHLVIKHKPSAITPSPARSVDSSASLSRGSSSLNHATVSAARPVPPPTRTSPLSDGSAAAPSGPRPSVEPALESNAGAANSDSDDPGAAFAWGAWGGYPGVATGMQAGAFSGYSFMRPFTSAAPEGSSAAAGQDASIANASAAAAMAFSAPNPYTFYNPIVGCAYQAAYSAALAALSVATQQQPQTQPPAQPLPGQPVHGTAEPSTSQGQAQTGGDTAGCSNGAGTPAEGAAASSGAGPSSAGATASSAAMPGPVQYAYVPMFVPAFGQPAYPYGFPGQYPFAPVGATAGARRNVQSAWPQGPVVAGYDNLAALLNAAGLADLGAVLDALDGDAVAALRRQGGAEGAGGAGAQAAAGLRQRRRLILQGPAAVAIGNDQAAARNRGGAGAMAGARRGPRVFTIRISARMLLQILVFAVVLYQHFTWRRFLALLIGGAVLFITSTWAPFRQLMRGIHAGPHRAAAAGGGAAAGGAAGAAGAGAGVRQQQEVQRRGIFHEILVFLVGFITSLLPAWNFNPEDAAAFAAAQEMVAEEERAGRQQAAAAAEAAGAEGAGADAAQAAPAEGGDVRREQAGGETEQRQPAAAAAADGGNGAAAAGPPPGQ